MVRHQLSLHGAGTANDRNSGWHRASRSRNIEEAKALGYQTRPVLIGPVTFLKLAKSADAGFDPLTLLDRLLPVYVDVLRELSSRGAEWVQIDEPCLVLDLEAASRDALRRAYDVFSKALPELNIMLTTYFGGLGSNLDIALALPVSGLHPRPRAFAGATARRP